MAKITAIFVLLSIHGSEAGIYSLFTPASRLSGFIMEKISPIGMDMCVRECSKRVSCASVNFHRGRLECELSYSDVTANPSNMTSDSEFIYMGRNQIPQVYVSVYFNIHWKKFHLVVFSSALNQLWINYEKKFQNIFFYLK